MVKVDFNGASKLLVEGMPSQLHFRTDIEIARYLADCGIRGEIEASAFDAKTENACTITLDMWPYVTIFPEDGDGYLPRQAEKLDVWALTLNKGDKSSLPQPRYIGLQWIKSDLEKLRPGFHKWFAKKLHGKRDHCDSAHVVGSPESDEWLRNTAEQDDASKAGTPELELMSAKPITDPTTTFQTAVQAAIAKLRPNAKKGMAAFRAAAQNYPDGRMPTSPARFCDDIRSRDHLDFQNCSRRSASWSRWLKILRDIAEGLPSG